MSPAVETPKTTLLLAFQLQDSERQTPTLLTRRPMHPQHDNSLEAALCGASKPQKATGSPSWGFRAELAGLLTLQARQRLEQPGIEALLAGRLHVARAVGARQKLKMLPLYTFILWMDRILHHLGSMGNHCSLAFPGDSSFQGFLGGAGFVHPQYEGLSKVDPFKRRHKAAPDPERVHVFDNTPNPCTSRAHFFCAGTVQKIPAWPSWVGASIHSSSCTGNKKASLQELMSTVSALFTNGVCSSILLSCYKYIYIYIYIYVCVCIYSSLSTCGSDQESAVPSRK